MEFRDIQSANSCRDARRRLCVGSSFDCPKPSRRAASKKGLSDQDRRRRRFQFVVPLFDVNMGANDKDNRATSWVERVVGYETRWGQYAVHPLVMCPFAANG